MKSRLALPVLLLACAFAAGAQAQVIGYNFRSGDVWVDSQLGSISDYGRHDRVYFVDDLVNSYGAPRYLVNDLLDKRHWDPGDVYYAAALAYTARRPLGDVTREYENSKGQGWGVVAQRMGIKPGSAEFHALKGQMGKSKGRYDARGNGNGNGHGKPEDAGAPGNSGKAHGNGGKGHGEGDQGEDEQGQGKGKGNSQGKGNKGKGHGH
jgi:hypothetical protein